MTDATSWAIEARSVHKAFGTHAVLKGMDLQVPRGSVFAFLGNNGQGKSTTIRLLSGLLRADGGQIRVLGCDPITERRTMLARMGCLIDAPSLYDNLCAREFLRIGCQVKRLPLHAIEPALRQVGLQDVGTRLVRSYSLGMKQRLAIAHALLGEPELLLLDEPHNGLDPQGQRDMRELIAQLPGAMGCTVLVSSHNLDEVQRMATHLALLHEGRIRFQGSMADLRARQRSSLRLDVGCAVRAAQALAGMPYTVETLSLQQIRVQGVASADCPAVHRCLIEADVPLYQSVQEQGQLERWFHSQASQAETQNA